MPIPMQSEMRPMGGQRFALLEDVFLRGGFRVVATYDELLDLHPSAVKPMMFAVVQNQRKVYWRGQDDKWYVAFILNSDGTVSITGTAAGSSGGSGTGSTNLFNFVGEFVLNAAYARGDTVLVRNPANPNDIKLYSASHSQSAAINPPDLDPANWTDLGNQISYVTGQQGPKGDKGDKGDRGLTGQAGADGQSVRYRQGYSPLNTYNKLDMVKAATNDPTKVGLYLALRDGLVAVEPRTDPSAWELVLTALDDAGYDASLGAVFKAFGNTIVHDIDYTGSLTNLQVLRFS